MATNQSLAIFDPAALPAFVTEAQDAGETNIVTRASTNTLSPAGKVWNMTLDGTKRPLMKTNAEGEEEPVQIFNGIILAYPERRGRAYYTGSYNPEAESTPECWSNDGITSDPNSTNRQSEKCAKCPQSAKGSKQMDNGKSGVACGQHRNIALIPSARIGDFPPMRLKISITGDFDSQDKEAQANGWYAFSNYLDFLKGKRVPFTYMLTTRIRFDPRVTFPKLQFAPGKWLTDEQYAVVKAMATGDEIDALLKTEFTPSSSEEAPATPAGLAEDDDDGLGAPTVTAKPKPRPAAPAVAPAKALAKAPAKAPAKVAAPVVEEEPEEEAEAEAEEEAEEEVVAQPVVKPKAPTVNPKAAQALAAANARKAAAQVEDDDGEPVPAKPAAKAPAKASAPAKPATPPVASSPAVNAVLGDWDD